MDSPKLKTSLKPGQELLSDELEKAAGILRCFDATFSSIKLYPADNPAAKKSIDSLYERMTEFLDEYEELVVSVGEFSFSYKGEILFQEEEKENSLPFFFFKDGLRQLSFHEGLKKSELKDFFELIREESTLSLEDSDIVNTLWAKDFAHIRYFAIDEFLDTDIGRGGEIGSVDKKEFSKGSITLTADDKIDLYKRSIALGLQLNLDLKEEEDNKSLEDFNLPYHVAAACQGETPELKLMLSEFREMPPMVAMVNMLFEILFLEERLDQFSATLNVLNQCYKEIVHKSNFALASLILGRIQELKDMFQGQNEEKEKSLEIVLQNSKGESFIASLRKIFLDGQIKDYDSFFQYLRLIGPSAFPIVGDIWEYSKDPFLLEEASAFLHELGPKDLNSFIKTASVTRASLTKEIVVILGRIGGKKILPYLISLADLKHKAIRLEIIHALSKIKDKTANQILMKFLSDEDEEVRTRAAMNLKYLGDKTTLNQVIQLAQEKDFKSRSKHEKKAILSFLANTKNGEVIALLGSILKKWSIFSMSKQNETRLCAVSALRTMATPKAVDIIMEGTKIRNKMIRRACKLALKKIANKDKPNQTQTSEQSV
ncbi:MAG: hypothetical protein GTN73_07135 [Candidatus Aminicenantes bacterium]|nr:hypothetical protein [Candidatus Aminicenantes bacterium]